MFESGECDDSSDISDGEVGGNVVSHHSASASKPPPPSQNHHSPPVRANTPVPLFKRRAQSNPNLTTAGSSNHYRPNTGAPFRPNAPIQYYNSSMPNPNQRYGGPPQQPPNMYRTRQPPPNNPTPYANQQYQYNAQPYQQNNNFRGGYR